MKRIGFLGAYSIDNAGDQLLGYAVRQAFRERLPEAQQVLLAPAMRGNLWRHAWDAERGLDVPVERIPADDSVKWAKGLDAVVIGGGGIVRLEPDFRPFVLGDPDRWNPKIPACWNAVGSEATPAYLADHGGDYRRIARCCETLSYVSVRNALTERFVRRCGYAGEVHVVPDPALLLDVPETDFAERTLRDAGVDTDAFVLGLSVGTSLRDPRTSYFYKELFGALGKLVARRAVEVVIFPFGEIYGDTELQRMAHAAIPGAKLVDAKMSALDRWRLIGALDLYLCTRYHAMLAAFAQDVPFVVMDEYLSDAMASSKIREFIADGELEGLYLAPYLSMHPAAKLENALSIVGADDFSFHDRLLSMQDRLRGHYELMIAAIQRGWAAR
jgi:hypothetical protein